MLSRHLPASGLTGDAYVARRISEPCLRDARIIAKDVRHRDDTNDLILIGHGEMARALFFRQLHRLSDWLIYLDRDRGVSYRS